MENETDSQWVVATRRLCLGILLRTIIAGVVLSPAQATIALLLSYFGLGTFILNAWVFGLITYFLIMLWAVRQALLQTYPQGMFHLVLHDSIPAESNPHIS